MQEGEPFLGGLHIDHGKTQPANTGNQPVGFETLQNSHAVQNAQSAKPAQIVQSTPIAQSITKTPPQAPTSNGANISVANASRTMIGMNASGGTMSQPNRFANRPISSSQTLPTTDIILDGQPKKRQKKWLVGVIVAVAVVSVVGLVVFLLTSSNQSQNTVVLDSVRQSYSIYSNFLLYGTEQTTAIDESIFWEDESIVNDVIASYSEDEKIAYTTRLSELYDVFDAEFYQIDTYKQYGDEENLVTTLQSSLGNGVESLSSYIITGDLPNEEITRTYLESGSGGVIALLDSKYGKAKPEGDNLYERFVLAKRDEVDKTIALYDYYSSLGCIKNSILDRQCVNENFNGELRVLAKKADDAISKSESLSYHIIADMMSSSSELYYILMEANE